LKNNYKLGRNPRIDEIKGLSILGVTYIHVHGSVLAGTTGYLSESVALLSRLAVPYFLIFFCFFFEKSIKNSTNHYKCVWDKFVLLMIPFCIWSTIYFLISANWFELAKFPVKIISMHWSGYGWSGQFFFIILFQLIVLFPVIRKLADKEWFTMFTYLFTTLICIWWTYFPLYVPEIIAKIGDRLVIYWLVYAIIGIKMARNAPVLSKHYHWFLLSIFLILAEEMIAPLNKGISHYIRISIFIAAILSLPVLISLPMVLWRRISSFLVFLGQNSLAIFVLNPFFIIFLTKYMDNSFYNQSAILTFIIFILLSCLISLICAYLSTLFKKLNIKVMGTKVA
jgi:uncharacterized membrane protein YcfT